MNAEAKMVEIQSATQLKDAGKTLHNTPLYAQDPHKAIAEFVKPFLDQVHIGPAKLLVATYRQPEKTAGGLFKTQKYLEEDKYQGITGLLLKMGPLSFTDDNKVKFGSFKASPFQWVIYKPENGRATELRGLHCRIIEDVSIDAIVDEPELLW
jgi:hypothetical protein